MSSNFYAMFAEYIPTPIVQETEEERIKATCMYVGSFAQPGEYKVAPTQVATQFDLSGVAALIGKGLIGGGQSVCDQQMQSSQPLKTVAQQQKKEPWVQAGYKLDRACYDYNSAKGCQRKTCRYQHIDKENQAPKANHQKRGYKKGNNGQGVSNRRFNPYY